MPECFICHEELDDTQIQLLCGHRFHYECILLSYKSKVDKYYNKISDHRMCPYCRKDGGYLNLKGNNIPLEGIHVEYSIFKNALRNNNKEIYMNYLDKTKCLAILKSGYKKGLQCSCTPLSGSDFCGKHKSKIKSDDVSEIHV